MLRFFDRLNLTPGERRLVVIVFLVAFVVLNYWLVWPRFSEFGALTEEIEAVVRKRGIYEREIARRPIYDETVRRLQESGSALAAADARIQFRSDMERLAREVGLSVPRWGEVVQERGGGQGTNAFFEAIALTLSQVSGTEGQIVDFLYRVGASNATIRVKDLTLLPGNFDSRAQGKTNLVATVKLVASIPKAAPPSGAPPASAVTPGSATPVAAAPAAAPATTPAAGAARVPAPTSRTVGRTNLPAPGT